MAPVFILTETSAGYALFKSSDKKLLKRTDIAEKTRTAEDTCTLYVASTSILSYKYYGSKG